MPSIIGSKEDIILSVAIAAAKAAGKRQVQAFGLPQALNKVYSHDIKLDIDRFSEEAIVNTISAEFPDHVILTEESGRIGENGEYVWFVDPLDGTMNYYYGLHYFCTCIACYQVSPDFRNPLHMPDEAENHDQTLTQDSLGKPVAGVIYAPVLDELFAGVSGQGATLNGRPLSLVTKDSLEEAIIALSFGSDEETIGRMERIIPFLARNCRKIRILGACGLDIANIAAEHLNALVHKKVRCWDFAAARIILEEAGGVVDARAIGPNHWDVLACTQRLHDTLLNILAE